MRRRVGILEVIAGGMYSGKTEELIRRVRREQIAKRHVVVFKHSLDDRYDTVKVASHNGGSIDAIPVGSACEIRDCFDDNPDISVVGIDEAQFFNEEIVAVVRYLADCGVRVVVAGLDKDFRGEPFGSMPLLLTYSEKTTKLTAICDVCGEDAYFTQRLVNGKPANYNDPIILIGAKESYEARCRLHHEVPGRPR